MYWEEKWGGEGVECKRLETWCDVSFGVETVNYGLSLTPPVLQHSTEWLAHLKTPQVQFYRPMITIAIAFLGFASLRKPCNFPSFLGQIKLKLLSSGNMFNIPGCLVLRSRQKLRYICFYPESHQSLGGNIFVYFCCLHCSIYPWSQIVPPPLRGTKLRPNQRETSTSSNLQTWPNMFNILPNIWH